MHMKTARLLFCLMVLMPGVTPAQQAQTMPDRQALLAAMRADPTDLELMFAYAAASVRAGDYEAAIATLERMLIFNADLPRVKLELGAAYYRLGAYDIARLHFEDVLASDPPDEVRESIAPFMAEIERRTAASLFTGFISAGLVYSSNANLGPQDREVLVSAFPNGVGTLPDDAVAADSFGYRLGAGLTHRLDMQRPTEDYWISTVQYAGLRYFSEAAGEFDAVEATTGPSLTIGGQQFGTTLRPFVQAGAVRSAGELLYSFAGGGAEIATPVSPELNVAGTVTGNWRHFDSESEFDGFYALASGGLTGASGPETLLRGIAFVETDRTDADFNANVEFGLRIAATEQFRVGAASFLSGPLQVTLFGQGSRRWFDAANPEISDTVRRDDDLRIGGQIFGPLQSGFGVSVDAGYFERFSNIQNYDLNNFEVGLTISATF
jgi:hypothetical protein